MSFFICRKNNVLYSRCRDVCFCETCRFQNLWHHHNASYTYAYFFRILSPIKMKFGQILVCCMTNISDMFLAECWRLGTSSRLFYDFIKMTIQQDLAIFNGWHVLYSPFQKNETLKSWHIWLLSNWGRLLNWKGPGI